MNCKDRVKGKVAIVTGASSGIGAAVALLLAKEGAALCVADVNVEAGNKVAAEIKKNGGDAIFVRADVGKAAQVKRMVERTEKAFGRLDILHNNAYWARNGLATDLEEKDWDRTIDVTLKAVYLGAKYAIPAMRKNGGGVIVNTGSVHSLVGFAGFTAYDAAKGGVLALTRTLAIDYGPDIRVNAVLPGAILTPAWKGVSKKDRTHFAKMVPAKRLGAPEDIARAVLFLASDEASFITGTSLTVDGGMLARTE
ncbi:MAG: SDR family NAD(P)-dependent oxidoreductase [Candidatus Latescibacterota bacterium]|jgi:meso-butanediol dehydrogenase/(S,S)-butanediol dehydrogenase/diacetyl reductase